MDYQLILDNIYDQILPFANEGKQADYIPALAKVNPDHFGMCLNTVNGESYSIQDSGIRFSIQSISKVFALALALSIKGEDIWKQVGKEPSGTAFNSLFQLELEKGIPRNPFINSGAMVITPTSPSERPQEKLALLASGSQTSSLQNHEKRPRCLSLPLAVTAQANKYSTQDGVSWGWE